MAIERALPKVAEPAQLAGARQDEAVEMLFRIQERSPGSQTAERALLRTEGRDYELRDGEVVTFRFSP